MLETVDVGTQDLNLYNRSAGAEAVAQLRELAAPLEGARVLLRPEWSALLMSVSSIIVAVNAVLLKGVELDLVDPGSDRPPPGSAPAT